MSSAELPELKEFHQWGRKPGEGLLLHPGSPCNNYKGYCDIFRKCRSVDANGPLARLKSLVFDPETIKTMSQWVRVGFEFFSIFMPFSMSFSLNRKIGGLVSSLESAF